MRRPAVLAAHALVLAAPALTLVSAPASAGLLTAQGIMSTFNVVTAGDLNSGSDIEGSAVVGGNLTAQQFFNNNVPASPNVYLYGQLNSNVNIDAGGSFYYGTLGAGFNATMNGNGHKQQGGWPNLITDYTTPLNLMSTQLSKQLQQNGNSIAVANNKITFSATAGTNGIAYFDLTAAQFTAYFNQQNNPVSSYAFAFGNGVTSAVINIDGNFTSPQNVNMNTIQQNVVFNFYDATSLALSSWETTVLAPNAVATLPGSPFDGFIYAQSVSTQTEIHDYVYTGSLPPPTKVPEPGALALLAAGLAAIACVRPARRAA
jgi:choice-of-anchor A domain-containing protein